MSVCLSTVDCRHYTTSAIYYLGQIPLLANISTVQHPLLPIISLRYYNQIPLVEGSRELRSLLLSSGCATFSTTPAFVRQLFRSLASRVSTTAVAGTASGATPSAAGADGTVSLRSGNPKARSNCVLLLHYCLEDLGALAGGRSDTGGYKDLAGLPLVPLADGSHGVFRGLVAVDSQKLGMIRGMGFSETQARQALAKHNTLQEAVDWLSGGGGDERGDEAERPFVLCGEEEAQLLAGAGASLISEVSLSDTSGSLLLEPDAGQAAAGAGAGTGQAGAAAAAVENDGRVLRALRSSSLQSALNITTMRDDLLPDLIGQTLPVAWRGGGSSTASATSFPWTPGSAGHPNADWFRRLWGYLASSRPSAVRLLAESFPVVPTGNSVVCPLSLRSAVIDGGKLDKDVRSIVVKAGCRTLLRGVFGGSGGDDAATLTPPPPPSAGEEVSKVGARNKSPAAVVIGQKEGSTPAGSAGAAQGRSLPPPPAELFEYVRPGTRAGVLAALGTARRSAGKPLKELMWTAGAGERDALLGFLAREPASEMTDVEVSVCRALPILPLHEDGLVAARALSRAVTGGSQAALKNVGDGSGGDGGTYASADAAPLYLLLEAGAGFVGVENKGSGDGEASAGEVGASPASPPPPQQHKWLETHLFTPSFVKVGGSGAGRKDAAEAALLERLDVKLIRRSTFFVDHVFPRIEELPNGLRDAAMVEALLAAPRLSQQHERFKMALSELEFVPTTSKVSCFGFVCFFGSFVVSFLFFSDPHVFCMEGLFLIHVYTS